MLVWHDYSDKEKQVNSGYGIAFDGAGSWNVGNDFAEDVAIFRVHTSSSSHADNRKNTVLVLSERPIERLEIFVMGILINNAI